MHGILYRLIYRQVHAIYEGSSHRDTFRQQTAYHKSRHSSGPEKNLHPAKHKSRKCDNSI